MSICHSHLRCRWAANVTHVALLRAALLLALLAGTAGGAGAVGSADVGDPAEPLAKRYGVRPPRLSELADEAEVEAAKCKRFGPYNLGGSAYSVGVRNSRFFRNLRLAAKYRLWAEWAEERLAEGHPPAESPQPNAVWFSEIGEYGRFEQLGVWHATGYALVCEAIPYAPNDEVYAAAAIDEPINRRLWELQLGLFSEDPATISLLSFLDSPQQAVATGLRQLTTGMDEFFADNKAYYNASGSFIRLTADTVFSEGGEVGFTGDIRLKLQLPATRNRLRLIVESDPDKPTDETGSISTPVQPTPADALDERSYFAGLQTVFGELPKVRVRPSIGVKLRSPLDTFVRLSFDHSEQFTDWLLYLNETLLWFDSAGFSEDTSMEWNRRINDALLFRSSSLARYIRTNRYFDLSQTFSLLQTLSPRRAVSYNVGTVGITDPSTHATAHFLNLHYRQNVHSDYMFMALIPQTVWAKEADFKPALSLTLRFEMVFKG